MIVQIFGLAVLIFVLVTGVGATFMDLENRK